MKLREFLDTIPKEITELRIIAAKQQVILEDHIYRTELAEKKLEILSEEILKQGRTVIALQIHADSQKSVIRTVLKIVTGVIIGMIVHYIYK